MRKLWYNVWLIMQYKYVDHENIICLYPNVVIML